MVEVAGGVADRFWIAIIDRFWYLTGGSLGDGAADGVALLVGSARMFGGVHLDTLLRELL